MTDTADLLTLLQHGDSQFPSGGFAFSWGLEGLQVDGLIARSDLASFLEGQFQMRWSNFDRVLIAEAHRLAADQDALLVLDDWIDATIPAAAARQGSKRAGQALLGVHARLGTTHAAAFRDRLRQGAGHGHAPVVQGLVLAGVGLDLPRAIAAAAHTTAVAICTAAIRLGLASHIDAQRALASLRPTLAAIIDLPLPRPDEIAAFTPASEIAMMRQAGQNLRLFSN